MDTKQETQKEECSISYKQLGLLILVFVLGLITALLLVNTKTKTLTTFTTTELIGFVLSVILSGASIVLAVSAIALGKSSEQAVIKRSDESIRLQNDVFIKTTEALQRIEASTGVTEKRIEDIISGRVGDISHNIAELATGRSMRGLDREELEKEIRRSILRGVKREKSPEEEAENIKKQEEKRKRYESFHQKVMAGFSNRPDTKAEKLGHGFTSAEGDEQFDGIFKMGNYRVGVSAFSSDVAENIDKFHDYIEGIAKNIISGNINYAVLVFDSDSSQQEVILNKISKQFQLYKNNPEERISVIATHPEEVEQIISDLPISYKQIQPTQ